MAVRIKENQFKRELYRRNITASRNIRTLRLLCGYTQQELADLAGISINTVVAAERGQGDPKISTYLSICKVLGLKLTAIL